MKKQFGFESKKGCLGYSCALYRAKSARLVLVLVLVTVAIHLEGRKRHTCHCKNIQSSL